MSRILAALSIIALILTLGSTGVSAGNLRTSMVAAATTCPVGAAFVKGYTKADGTKVAGYCRTSKTAMKAACPSGQSMVAAYTKKDGTKVKAYCRKG